MIMSEAKPSLWTYSKENNRARWVGFDISTKWYANLAGHLQTFTPGASEELATNIHFYFKA